MSQAQRDPATADLLRKLASDGACWAEAELALTRAEAGSLLRRVALGLAVAVVAFLLLIVALIVLVQAAVAAIAPLAGSEALAGLIVAVVLVAAVAGLAYWARSLVLATKARPASLVLRWISGTGSQESFTK